jgi:hypothetical protein
MTIEQRRGERCTDPECPDRREGYQHAHMRLPGHPLDIRLTVDRVEGRYVYEAAHGGPQHERLMEWLRANGVEPRNTPAHAAATIKDGSLTIQQFARNEQGMRWLDPSGDEATRTTITVPLKVELSASWAIRAGGLVVDEG